MTTLYKWRLFCITENDWVYIWSESDSIPPTTCITNTSHTVNGDSQSVVDFLTKNLVKIDEETIKTQGNFRTECMKIDIPSNTQEVIAEKIFDYPINLLGVYFHVTDSNTGDMVNAYLQPQYQGTILQDCVISEYTIIPDSTTYAILNIGYTIFLETNTPIYHSQNLGEVLQKNNGILTVSNPVDYAFTSNESTLKIQVNGVKNLNLCNTGRHQSGTSKLGSTYINKNAKIIVKYSSNTVVDIDRHFHYELEYLY